MSIIKNLLSNLWRSVIMTSIKAPAYEDAILLNLEQKRTWAHQERAKAQVALNEVQARLGKLNPQNFTTMEQMRDYQALQAIVPNLRRKFTSAKEAVSAANRAVDKRLDWLGTSAGIHHTKIAQLVHRREHGEKLSIAEQAFLER